MATAIGAYATLVLAKARLKITDSTDDTLIQSFCDGVNGWIESKTGRILAPIPVIATSVSSGGGAGSQAVTLASAAGIAAGDALMFGPISGTHEHQIVTSVAGNIVTLQSPLVATYAGGVAVSRVQLFDGWDALENGRLLPCPNGVIGLSSLEVAYYTNAAFTSIPMTDIFIRPTQLDREPGWPGTEIWMADIPSAGNSSPIFFSGFANVRCAGAFGWPAIPDEITTLALNLVVTLYRRRGVGGGGDTVQTGSDGARTISLLLDSNDWRTINRYSSKEVVIV